MSGEGEGTFPVTDPAFEARIRGSFARQSFMATLGAEITAVAPGRCDIRVPWKDGLGQQHGYFHAGVLGAIADSAAGYAAYTLMGADDTVLSIEYKINLLRPANGDAVIARAKVIRPGRLVTACTAEVFVERDGEEIHCAAAQLTMIRVEGKSDA
ncbi:PaaI family thioesterase [bacterium]|nr:PaaI family thioesterase [bacterium]